MSILLTFLIASKDAHTNSQKNLLEKYYIGLVLCDQSYKSQFVRKLAFLCTFGHSYRVFRLKLSSCYGTILKWQQKEDAMYIKLKIKLFYPYFIILKKISLHNSATSMICVVNS